MKKFILTTLAILAVILVVLFFLIGRYTDRVIDPYVRSLLDETKPMNHKVVYGKIKVDLFQGMIRIKDVNVYPDSSLNKSERPWMDLRVSTIHLTDFRLLDMVLHKSLKVGGLELLHPDLEVHLPLERPDEILDDLEVKEKKKTKAPLLTSISLDQMFLSDGTFRLIRNGIILASSDNINVFVDDIRLKRDSREEPIGYSYGEVNVLIYDIALYSESGLYDMSLGSFEASKGDSVLILKDFRMIPKYDKKAFYKDQKFTRERFDIRVGELSATGVSFRKVLNGQPLEISAIRIDSVNADIYKDKNLPFDLTKFPLFYNESFANLKVPIRIDTVEMTHSRLLYNELAAGRTEIGAIALEDFAMQAYGLTNIAVDDSVTNEMHLYVQALVMGEGKMNLELNLPMEGEMRRLECSGSVGAMQLTPLNGMLEPSLNIRFDAGKVNSMTFAFTGDNKKTDGWMEFLYEDVDVEILKKEPDKSWGFVSFLANRMTHSNNPVPGKTAKLVWVGVDRDVNKGLINFVWRTIQSGMIHTILPISKFQLEKKPLPDSEPKAKKKKAK